MELLLYALCVLLFFGLCWLFSFKIPTWLVLVFIVGGVLIGVGYLVGIGFRLAVGA
jgi:hypothetical protein